MDIINSQMTHQILNSVSVEATYTNVESEYFTIFEVDNKLLIRPQAMKVKQIPEILAIALRAAIELDFDCVVREYDFKTNMGYDEFWDQHYNKLATSPLADQVNSELNYP